jgi:membrane protease YdiL (CAAX protease family)
MYANAPARTLLARLAEHGSDISVSGKMTSTAPAVMRVTIDGRKAVALALPIAIPVAMAAAFRLGSDRLGDHGGYLAGFGVYWATCAGLSVGLLGRRRIRELFRDRRPRLGTPKAVGAALLLWPPLGAIATRFIPEIGQATVPIVVTILCIALVNAVLEELLWRGVYISLWPRNPWLGWMWPAIGFGLWHLAPQVIHASSMGPLVYVVSATGLGLSWGWVAWRTGSLRWVSVSHVFTDGSGLRNAVFFLG